MHNDVRDEAKPQELEMSMQRLLDDVQGRPGSYLASFTAHGEAALWLERHGDDKLLVLVAPSGSALAEQFHGSTETQGDGLGRRVCETSTANANALRHALPWLTPMPLGLATSAGFGDRLGLATPGHVSAMTHAGEGISPIFAQQSIREMTRTRRTPDDVMRDATWGAFEAGWHGTVGADADHLKTFEDIDRCAAAGFTFYTIDPGEHVDDAAHHAPLEQLNEKVAALPWDALESSMDDLRQRYADRTLELDDRRLKLEPEGILRAAAKYGRAVAHVATMYRHLVTKGIAFELEVSVDETETPTSHVEHAFIASELTRLGVHWVSLAPRYVGQFEKGIDYIGDLAELRDDLAGHAALARALGPYKLSLHSGSDKFSVYPLIHELTGGLVHLKTAGTSYLEALRVVASADPHLFRDIGTLARERFDTDRASYHISAKLRHVPDMDTLADGELPTLLDEDNARQVLHVTFGSVLDRFKPRLVKVLRAHEEAHHEGVARHFEKHLQPFGRAS
jgi:hypothetical protein